MSRVEQRILLDAANRVRKWPRSGYFMPYTPEMAWWRLGLYEFPGDRGTKFSPVVASWAESAAFAFTDGPEASR